MLQTVSSQKQLQVNASGDYKVKTEIEYKDTNLFVSDCVIEYFDEIPNLLKMEEGDTLGIGTGKTYVTKMVSLFKYKGNVLYKQGLVLKNDTINCTGPYLVKISESSKNSLTLLALFASFILSIFSSILLLKGYKGIAYSILSAFSTGCVMVYFFLLIPVSNIFFLSNSILIIIMMISSFCAGVFDPLIKKGKRIFLLFSFRIIFYLSFVTFFALLYLK